MFRFIIDIREINIDKVNLPKVPGLGLIKHMPNNQKFSMLVNMINSQKEQFLPKLEEEAAKRWGYIHITDMAAEMPTDGSCYIRFRVDVSNADYDKAIDSMLPSIFQMQDVEPVFQGAYNGPYSVPDIIGFMHQAPTTAQKEFYLVKTLSCEKATLISRFEAGAAAQQATLQISSMRFLLKQ